MKRLLVCLSAILFSIFPLALSSQVSLGGDVTGVRPNDTGPSLRTYEMPKAPNLANRSESAIVLRPCMMINRNTFGNMIFDFDKSAGAVQLALDYVTNNVLPDDVVLEMVYINLGPICNAKSLVVSHAMNLWDKGINCNAYIGPGMRSHILNVNLVTLRSNKKKFFVAQSNSGVFLK
jgi:hypothetical protein